MISLQEFREELELMKRQYGQEEELYPYIYMLLREAGLTRRYSVRSVAGAQSAKSVKGRELLRGYAGFPDIAILDKSFLSGEKYEPEEEIKKIYCCVEAKKINEELLNIEGEIQIKSENETSESFNLYQKNGKVTAYGQLIGELLWYGRVIYTNGYEWKYLEIKDFDNLNIIENLAGRREKLYKTCVKKKNKNWCKKFEKTTFKVIERLLIKIDEKTTESDWEDFKTKLRIISKDWKKWEKKDKE